MDRVSPNVALVDLWLGEVSAIEAIRTLPARQPPVPCVLLSAARDEQVALAAAVSGCAAAVKKQELVVEGLVELLHRAVATPAGTVAPEPARGDEDPVLTLLLQGRTDSEIALLLEVDEHEVRRLVAAWLDRLGLASTNTDASARITERSSPSRLQAISLPGHLSSGQVQRPATVRVQETEQNVTATL